MTGISLGLGLENLVPRSWFQYFGAMVLVLRWSWSHDHAAKVLVSRPWCQGLVLGLKTQVPVSIALA